MRTKKSVDGTVSERSEFHDAIINYGIKYMTYSTYVTGGSYYNAVFDTNNNVVGLVVSQYQKEKSWHTYYWSGNQKLYKTEKMLS